MRQIIFLLLSCLVGFQGFPQQKHALLVGINDYYEVPGIKSEESLRGPVNDVNAIRDLLVQKFGVLPQNIDILVNANATRDNIVSGLVRKLDACKPGDQMIFFYSGHGIWIENNDEALKKDSIKQGLSQAMLTSDLYNFNDKFKCLLRDVTLKEYFNRYVDKKVSLTALMDCCYSGNLARVDKTIPPEDQIREKSIEFNDLVNALTKESENTAQLLDSIMDQTQVNPPGCKLDANGKFLDNTDTDGDGVPDCMDRQPATPAACRPVSTEGVGLCPFTISMQETLNRFDKKEWNASRGAFNGRQMVRINERDNIVRPSDRKDSRFLFISAATDRQKALEFKNEDKVIHGLFTASIIRVLSANPPDMPVELFFEKLKADMASKKKGQDPVMYGDPARYKMNLIGGRKR